MPHTDSALWKFFRLTRISQISRFSFDGGKSHGGSTVCGFWAHTDSTDLTEKIREIRAIRVRFPATNYFQPMAVRKRRYATAARMATMV